MTFVLPPSVNYQSPIQSLPDTWQQNNPPEGARMIPFQIQWGTMGGAASQKAVSCNVRGGGQQSPNDFTNINALSIDNSQCGADIQFVFTDTDEIITIPAYAPLTIVPVFSRSQSFYVLTVAGQSVLSTDTTRFKVHNTLPPLIAVPVTQEQNAAAITATDISGGGPYQIVGATISGTLQVGLASMSASNNGGGSYTSSFALQDGTGRLLGSFAWSAFPGGDPTFNPDENAIIWQVGQVNMRFSGGISIVQTNIGGAPPATAAYLSTNLYYRTP